MDVNVRVEGNSYLLFGRRGGRPALFCFLTQPLLKIWVFEVATQRACFVLSALDFGVELLLVVKVVRKGRVHLSQREVGILATRLLRAIPELVPVNPHVDHPGSGPRNASRAALVPADVFVRRRGRVHESLKAGVNANAVVLTVSLGVRLPLSFSPFSPLPSP